MNLACLTAVCLYSCLSLLLDYTGFGPCRFAERNGQPRRIKLLAGAGCSAAVTASFVQEQGKHVQPEMVEI